MKFQTILIATLLLASLVAVGDAKFTYPDIAITGGDVDGIDLSNATITDSTFDGADTDDWHMTLIAGGAAGNHTLTGAAVGDKLCGVLYYSSGNALTDIASEFTGTGKGIIATNVVANGGGTNTSGGKLVFMWIDRT